MDRSQALRMADQAMGLSRMPRRSRSKVAPSAEEAPVIGAQSAREPLDVSPMTPVVVPRERAPVPPAAAATALRVVLSNHAEAATVQDPASRAQALQALRERHDRTCPHCTTATAHTHTVFGEGNAMARIMFIGEAPGETEDQTGRPFVGPAGDKLNGMITAMGLRREDVYIANVLKSRPPDNRTPLQHEVDACGPFLIEQILLIRPEVLITLGGPATKLILGTEAGISRVRGIWAEWAPPAGHGAPIPVMPTYHPAYLLRNYTAKTRGEVWSDLQAVMARLNLPARG
jgi:DNA polymerase